MKPKVLLLATIALLISSSLFAQKPDTTKLSKIPDYRGVKGDSTVIPKGRQSQQTDFLKGAYMYPPKPRNMWEVGIGGGTAFVSGDVSSKIGYGFDAYVRKSLGYVLSARLMYNYEVMSGIDGGRQPGIEFNNALNGKNSAATDYYHDIGFVYDNYQCKMQNLNLDFLIALNNIGFHKAAKDRKFIINGIVGVGGMMYNTMINQLDASGKRYDYTKIPSTDSHSQAISALNSLLDNTYETEADQVAGHSKLGSNWFDFVFNAGVGIQYHVSKRVSLGLEFRNTLVHDDELDGERWQASGTSLTPNYDSYSYESLNIGFVLGKRGVEPLYWQNPLDYTYDALNTVQKKMADMLMDSDGDGVPDYLDKEPNTPAGMPVDTHGVSLKLDNNGIPHYDAKGNEPNVAMQSSVDSLKNMMKNWKPTTTGGNVNWYLPMIFFDLDKDNVKAQYYPELKYVATVMKAHPGMNVVISGYTDVRASDKYNMDLAQRRANNTKDYLVKTYGIDASRLSVKAAGKDDPLVPGLKATYPYKEDEQQVNRRVEFIIQQ